MNKTGFASSRRRDNGTKKTASGKKQTIESGRKNMEQKPLGDTDSEKRVPTHERLSGTYLACMECKEGKWADVSLTGEGEVPQGFKDWKDHHALHGEMQWAKAPVFLANFLEEGFIDVDQPLLAPIKTKFPGNSPGSGNGMKTGQEVAKSVHRNLRWQYGVSGEMANRPIEGFNAGPWKDLVPPSGDEITFQLREYDANRPLVPITPAPIKERLKKYLKAWFSRIDVGIPFEDVELQTHCDVRDLAFVDFKDGKYTASFHMDLNATKQEHEIHVLCGNIAIRIATMQRFGEDRDLSAKYWLTQNLAETLAGISTDS
jgi:hypothetical protein